MSWLDGMIEDGEAASQDQRLGRTADKLAPGVFTGSLRTIGPNLLRGAIEGGRTIQSTALQLGSLAIESDLSIGSSYAPDDGQLANQQQFRETKARDIGEATAKSVMSLRPDPTEVGLVGQILGEAAAVLPRTIAGAFAAGPVGAAVAAGAPAGFSSKQVGMEEGLDESTATKKGLIDAATTGIGVLLPAAKIVKPILGDAAIAVGANVGLGMGGRAATAALLESNGYHSQAAQYKVMDGTALATDAIMGLAFFGIGRVNFRRPTAAQVDAALTERTNQHADVDTAPGAPVDPKSAMAHQDAIHTAVDQLSRGERVEVPPSIHEAEFLNAKTEGVRPTDVLRSELRGMGARDSAGEFAGRVGRDASYDEAGVPTFRDGTAYNLDEVGRFFDTYVAPATPKDGAKMPDVLFSIGRVDDATFQGLSDHLPGFNENLREARISARTIKHIQDSRPEIVKDVLDRLERGVLNADEVLPNPKNPNRVLVVLHDDRDIGRNEKRHQSTVLEVSANGKGIDVVSAMTMPERTLVKARAAKEAVEASRAEGLHSPHPHQSPGEPGDLTRQQSNFPAVDRNASDASISKQEGDASDPELQVAQEILARAEDMRIGTGAMDADGNPITVSAREMMANADADIVKAQQDAKGFAAAAACFLQRGL